MAWYVELGKLVFKGAKTVAMNKGVQGAAGTVGTAWLLDRFVTRPKEERARKSSTDGIVDSLRRRIDELEKELRKRK